MIQKEYIEKEYIGIPFDGDDGTFIMLESSGFDISDDITINLI